jgi:hypothetical protein
VSSATVFFALVAGWVAIVVLWQLTVGDSLLYALAVLRARLRHRWPQWRDRVAFVLRRSRAATLPVAWPPRRRYLAGALAGAATVGLTAVAAVGVVDFGSKGPQAANSARANPARLHPSRPLAPPATAAHSHTRRPTRVTVQARHSRVQRATKVVTVVWVSARAAQPASPAAASTQVARSSGPAPLPAPPGSSAPNPLAAP